MAPARSAVTVWADSPALGRLSQPETREPGWRESGSCPLFSGCVRRAAAGGEVGNCQSPATPLYRLPAFLSSR